MRLPAPVRPAARAARAAAPLATASALALALAPAAPVTAAAQAPDTARARADSAPAAAADSLAERLARAEAAIELLRQQLAAEAQSAVRARSRASVELFARALANLAYSSGAANDAAVPTFALAPGPGTGRAGALPFVVRQTRFGAALTVREVLGGTFDGDLDFDLYGGRNAEGEFPLFPVPRLRTARAWLRWPRTALMAGSETPLVSDLDPLTVAAVGVPGFTAAGNLWNWLPQLRAARELGGARVRWGVQGAVVAPFAGVPYQGARSADPYGTAPTGSDAAERAGRPFLQARLRARWGAEEEGVPFVTDVRDAVVGEGASEVGLGVHRGWVRADDGRRLPSSALAVDARVVLAPRVELRGEAYAGELTAGLGGGAVGQSFGQPAAPATGRGAPLRNAAGWVQLNVRPTEAWLGGAGCGADRVRAADRPVRRRNAACAAHLRWKPVEPLLLGAEYRRLSTAYPSGTSRVHHVNLALGFEL